MSSHYKFIYTWPIITVIVIQQANEDMGTIAHVSLVFALLQNQPTTALTVAPLN